FQRKPPGRRDPVRAQRAAQAFRPVALERVRCLGRTPSSVLRDEGHGGRAGVGHGSRKGYQRGSNPAPKRRKFRTGGIYLHGSSRDMDSMVNHYTAGKKRRSSDAYTPDAAPGRRPDYASAVYARRLKKLFPDVPLVLGGVEASLRRLAHYDYWSDRVRHSILVDCPADILVYGMGEQPILEIAARLAAGEDICGLTDVRGTAVKFRNDAQ